MTTRAPQLMAAIDLGSNSFRLEIGRVTGDALVRVEYLKETVRLGAGLDGEGVLSTEAIDRGIACLQRFGERLRGLPAARVRAVATATLRFAINREDFLRPAMLALGYPIEVISGREEARLIYQGVAHLLPSTPERRLVVDIGGGSTELIVGQGFNALSAESYKLGCVSHTRRFFPNGEYTESAFSAAEIDAAAELEEARPQFAAGPSRGNWSVAYGSSGTIGAIADIARAMGLTRGAITAASLHQIRNHLLTAGHADRIELPGLKPDRIAVLPGGFTVLAGVFRMLGVTEMRPAKGALRHGVLYDLLGRRELIDTRDATVEAMVDRFGIDRIQAERVADLAARLYRQLTGKTKNSDPERMLMRAAMLHEIGFIISHGDYHKHGAYILEHGDLSGFSTDDQTLLAKLVLAQRGNLKKIAGALDDDSLRHPILALRLAVLLAHGRAPVRRPAFTLELARGNGYVVHSPTPWLKTHPLTYHLIEEEIDHWRKVGVKLTLAADD
jgi:exopolyphosphatase / guanosine-5'-triphosphate,3'-diphosphate pyrophosphatase